MNIARNHIIRLVFVLLLGTHCSRSTDDTSQSQPRNVFGEDARTSIDLPIYPLSAIGRLDSGCTGTLISPWLMLTAAHCLVDSKTGRVKPSIAYFRPAYGPRSKGIKIWIEQFWIGTHSPEENRPQDFAIVKLATEVSDTFGQMAIAPYGIETGLPAQVDLAGYSSDRSDGEVISAHHLCMVRRDDGAGKLLHDCHSAAGVSGGPLFRYTPAQANTAYIVGITVSEFRRGAPDSVYRDAYSDDYANVAISATHWRDAANRLIALSNQIAANTSIAGTFHLFNNNPRPPDDPEAPRASCSVGNCAINGPLLHGQTAQLENTARIAAVQADYCVQFARGNPHPLLGELAKTTVDHALALARALASYGAHQIDDAAITDEIASHLPAMLTGSQGINQYIAQNYAVLAALDNRLKPRADHLSTTMQGLERLILSSR